MTKFFLPLILAAGMHAVSIQAQPKYTVTAICQGSGGGINSNGDVCGSLTDAAFTQHAFLYKKGKLTDLGVYKTSTPPVAGFPPESDSTSALAVNNADFVVGSLFDFVPVTNDFTADSFAYSNGKIVPIAPGSSDGGFSSAAAAVNNSGEVAGSYAEVDAIWNPITGYWHARGFLYRNGMFADIGSLGGYFSEAFDINGAGQIVGSSTPVLGGAEAIPWEAFLYRNGKMQAIGGASSNRFVPSAINDNGWIAGAVYAYPVELSVYGGVPGAVLEHALANGTSVQNLSTAVLYINGRFTNIPSSVSAVSINNAGTVIGYSATSVFIYGGGKSYDLNALVQGNWTITEVGHINDAGQIAATGIVKGSDGTVTYALSLSPANNSLRP
jgi:probable HAF family extracellular repeat protein